MYEKYRWLHNTVTDELKLEAITWQQTTQDDPRGVILTPMPPNSQPDDKWIPIFIANAGFDLSSIAHTYTTGPDKVSVDEEGVCTMVPTVEAVESFVQMDVYSQPLLPDWVEITMMQYNNMISS